MSTQKMVLNIERPDTADKSTQGERGPFSPIIMTLQTLVGINRWQLRQRRYPLLYRSGIYYKTIPPATQWYDIPTLMKVGYGDCKNLVAWRVAELLNAGVECKPCIKWKYVDCEDSRGLPFTILLIHVMVMYPDGRIEDPSAILGMKGEFS